MKPFLVLIFGPPGSGKSTQAENVAKKFGAVHVDTGELLRRILHDPAQQHDPKIQEERVKHETDGQLNDSLWVGGIVNDELRKLAADGKSVSSSGFPRTIFEAEIELPVMRGLFGERIFAFILRVGEETSLFRNSRRRICTKCHKPHLWSEETKNIEFCAGCGADLTTRLDDKPDVIKKRLDVYKKRTLPIFNYLESNGLKLAEVDGELAPEAVFTSIQSKLSESLPQ